MDSSELLSTLVSLRRSMFLSWRNSANDIPGTARLMAKKLIKRQFSRVRRAVLGPLCVTEMSI